MNGLRKLIITIAAVAMAMTMAAPGQADVIYSNIQPGDNFGPGVAIGVVPFVGVFITRARASPQPKITISTAWKWRPACSPGRTSWMFT
jgi:hypothetical protein